MPVLPAAVPAGWVTQALPGVNLDQGQLTAFMVASMTTVVAPALKWLQDRQQHERLVSDGRAEPVRPPQQK
ncbi:hypothetical protein ACFFMN_35835 [Planobispora siamensis]|uniref:Uncharacterized protein n=1 Tax=Planobispora siamensis TaxID=936338 RepID=A0A8J3SKY5_9ACTN|nr:hypothetical protein [Planobispora siamensis]GIH95159.1 hypothetical protein Psi01_57890 [Planobispora siamensis]